MSTALHHEQIGGGTRGCRLLPMEGAAHMPNMERPLDVNTALEAFLDDQ
jgi:pimeloyl-ACP methyl ester carboxylesterase